MNCTNDTITQILQTFILILTGIITIWNYRLIKNIHKYIQQIQKAYQKSDSYDGHGF